MTALFAPAVLLCAVLFGYTQCLIFFQIPMDRMLMWNQKIFYYHVPCAFVLFIAVITCGVASVLYLRRRDPRYDDVAAAAGALSVLFGAIVLITGSIWGRAAWSVWWQWDARLTSSLLLWMVMLGYLLVRKYGGPSADKLAAGLAIFGMADVPLIYFSVKIWRTLHPQTSVVPTLKPEMRAAFWLCVLLFILFYILLQAVLTRQARLDRRLELLRNDALDGGLIDA